ncbi:MAG: NAD-dependent epimerase/dehydratase family protein [Persicimonas sp.]
MTMPNKKKVVVAGASGFIGQALPAVLGQDYELVGLSREPRETSGGASGAGYRWRRGDLFSRKQTDEALEGANLAVYLVHSMHPSARLTQGEVGDLDLVCADNFARAARRHKLEHIVYVSGIVPRGEEDISEYLASRLEVEQTLQSYGTPVTTLRAALVIGAGGNGTEMILRLVDRLPAMLLPGWTDSQMAPIARSDMAELVGYVLGRTELAGDSYDVGGPDVVTFREMLEITADLTGRRVRLSSIGLVAPALSSAWVTLWSRQPKEVVRPLIESLRHDLLPADRRLQEAAGQRPVPVREALRCALAENANLEESGEAIADETSTELVEPPDANDTRAVHRLELPVGRDAGWIADEYGRWLPSLLRPFLKVERDHEASLSFYFRPLPWPLLVLELDESVSADERQLYWIRGGVLSRRHKRARLEFREVLGGRKVLAAIHEFHPRLPWPVYLGTQAKIHHFVMGAFDRHLKRISRRQRQIEASPSDSEAT